LDRDGANAAGAADDENCMRGSGNLPANVETIEETFPRRYRGERQRGRLCEAERCRLWSNKSFVDELVFGVATGAVERTRVKYLIALFEELGVWSDGLDRSGASKPRTRAAESRGALFALSLTSTGFTDTARMRTRTSRPTGMGFGN
jgi:hypothetical protein